MNYTYSDELYHFGISGMKWGVRRYQNEDGSLTEAGKNRYRKQVDKVMRLQLKAVDHRRNVNNRNEYKIAKLNRKAEKYKLKRAKTLKAASRFIAPLKPKVAIRRLAKYELKSEKAELKAQKLVAKMAKEKVTADKYEEKAKKLIAKIQKEYANVPMSELETIPKKVGFGTAAMGLARYSQELGVKSRESDRYPDEGKARHGKAR